MSRFIINRSVLLNAKMCSAKRLASSKVFPSAAAAIADIKPGHTLCVGGFGLCGIPECLIEAIKTAGTKYDTI
jgi:hypothetical protein